MNLSYGGLTLAYGRLTASAPGADRAQEVFAASARFWTPWFLVAGGIVWLVIRLRCGGPLAQCAQRPPNHRLWNLL